MSDAHGNVTLINSVAEQQLGIDRATLIGRPLSEVLTLRDQDGAEWFASNCPYEGLNIRSGIPEQPWFLPNGHEVLVAAASAAKRDSPSGRGRGYLDAFRSRSGAPRP